MAKGPDYIFLEVLQNGSLVCEHKQLFTKSRKPITLGTHSTATLTLPHYPLPATIEVIRLLGKQAEIELRSSWDGFITSEGSMIELSELEGKTSQLANLARGDYGVINIGDLQLLIRIGKEHSQIKINKREQKKYRAPVTSLFFYKPQESRYLLGGGLVAASLVLMALFGITQVKSDHPTEIEDLSLDYVRSFMYPEHFSTLPEALQVKLDRNHFASSAIKFYKTIASILMDWEVPYEELFFENSRKRYQSLFAQRNDHLHEMQENQKRINKRIKDDNTKAILSIPAVQGESIAQSSIRIFDKIDSQQQGFKERLDLRRRTKTAFEEAKPWNYTDYKTKKGFNKEAAAALSKISPFKMETNEMNMYRKADELAQETLERRQIISAMSAPKHQVTHPIFTPIELSDSVNFASFIHLTSAFADDERLESIDASHYGTKAVKKVREPLIGEIDPKLIERAITKNKHDLQLCYELALRRDKKTRGEMQWRWRIDSRGDISDLELVSSTIKDRGMMSCIRRKIASWAFPRPRRGSVEITYPFRFAKSQG